MGLGMSKMDGIKGSMTGNQLQSGITEGASIGTVCSPTISYYTDSTCTTANYQYKTLTPVLYNTCF